MRIFNIFLKGRHSKRIDANPKPVKVLAETARKLLQPPLPVQAQNLTPINVSLKTAFRKQVNFSVDTYERILTGSAGKTLGSLPKDILSAIIQAGNRNKQEKAKTIKQVQRAFHQISEILNGYTQIETEAYRQGKNLSISPLEVVRQILKQPISLRAVDCTEQTAPLFEQSEKILQTAMSAFMPNETTVRIRDIGNGYFGNVFKISFTNPDGKNIFNDLIIKCFKSELDIFTNYIARLKFAEKFGKSMDKEELQKLILKIYPDMEKSELKAGNLEFYTRMVCQHKSDDIFMQRDFIEGIHSMHNSHGAMAEANNTEFIRFFTGRKLNDKDDIILPFFFGFGRTPFCLAKFEKASKDTAPPARQILRRFPHLIHKDARHDGNKINGRVIDMGGITVRPEVQNSSINKTEIKRLKKQQTHKA